MHLLKQLVGTKSLFTVLLLLTTVSVEAGGLWLNEYGSPAMGRARAGAAAGDHYASTVLHNPASMGFLSESQWMATGGLIYSRVEFDLERSSPINGTNEGDDAGGVSPGGSLFYVDPQADSPWSWGISVAGLAGTVLDYENSWAGRFQATKVTLATLGVSPAVSYEVNDWLAVGASLQLVYAELEVILDVPVVNREATIDGDDTVPGFQLGMVAALDEKTRLGLVYQSKLDFEFEGDVDLPSGAQVGVDTDLPLAAYVRLGLKHQWSDHLSVYSTLGWDDWSTLDNVNLSTNSGGAAIATDWDDTYHYALGVEYKLTPQWLLSSGMSYDTNPADKENRNAQLPVDRQMRYALGLQYQPRHDFSVGGQFVYADLGKASIEGVGFGGDFKRNDVFFISINANWRL